VLRGTVAGLEWEHGHAKADAAVRGPAANLLLAMFRRSQDGVDVVGDASVWTYWLDRTGF
jgi:hypothetical protein